MLAVRCGIWTATPPWFLQQWPLTALQGALALRVCGMGWALKGAWVGVKAGVSGPNGPAVRLLVWKRNGRNVDSDHSCKGS